MSDSTAVIRTFKYRLYPTRSQESRMLHILDVCRSWYNMCLAERKWAFQLEARSIGRFDQEKLIKQFKRTFPQASRIHTHCLRVATLDVDKAFSAFFQRVQSGKTPGFPRFKGKGHFNSFGFKEYGNGFRIDGRRLKLSTVGRVAVRWHRPVEGNVKTVRIVRKAGKWYACFACEVEPAAPLPATGRAVGIDVGISAIITTSDGEKVANPNYYRAAQAELRRRQRKLARCKRGSKNRRKALRSVQRQQEHVANQRKDFLHKLSATLVRDFDAIALEDLRVSNMARNHRLSKSIMDSGWSTFRGMLTYKAESAGRQLAFVDPAYTSKCCSACGAVFQDFDLSTRWVKCDCGLSLDRDHNAAINILKRSGWDAPIEHNAGECVERAQEAALR